MKVEMIATISGTRDGVDWPGIGGVLDVSEDEGKQLVAGSLARVPEKKSVEPVVEKATAKKAEVRKGLTTDSVK